MDQTSMEWIVETYSPQLLRAAFLYLQNSADAEDVVQEVMIAYWKRQPRFGNEAARKTWLYKATLNRSRDLLRSGWHRRRAALTEDLSYLPPEQSELLRCLWQLEPKYRIPIHLHYYEGYQLKEIAAMLQLPLPTVGSRLHRGREQLRQLLGGDLNDII